MLRVTANNKDRKCRSCFVFEKTNNFICSVASYTKGKIKEW